MLYFIIFIALVVLFIKNSNLVDRVNLLEAKVYPKQTDEVNNTVGNPNNSVATEERLPVKIQPVVTDISPEIPPVVSTETVLDTNIPEPIILDEKTVSNQNFEFKLGAKFFTVVGSIAITFGVGYFLKFAIDNGMISETWRVIIGIIIGSLITILGIWLSKKYSLFGQILSGTGLGLIYLSVYAAYGFYELVPVSAGFIGLFIVTIIGTTLAVYQNLLWMAVFSQFGAYLAPVLLFSGENHPHILFIYVIGIIIGTFGVAWFKLWRPLIAVNFVATTILFFSWAVDFLDKDMVGVAVIYLTIFFTLFMAILLVNYRVRKAEQNDGDFVLLSLNSLLTFAGYYGVVNYYYHDLMGVLTITFSALHFMLLALIKSKDEPSRRFKEFLLAIGSILFTISLPIIFDSSSVLTIAWSLEAAALVLFGIRLQSYAQRSIGLIIQVIVLSRVLFLGILSSTHLPGTVAFFNERFLTLLLVTVVTAIIGWIYYKNKDSVLASELVLIKIVPVLVGIQIFIFGSVEIFDFLAHYWLIAFWSILVFVVLTIGNLTKSKGLVNVGYFIMVINGIIFMAIGSGDGVKDAFINPYFNVVIFATIMGIISVLSLRAINKRDEGVGIESISLLSVYSYFAIIVAFSKEIIIYNYSYAFLPVVWSICAIILLVVAYYFKSKILRFTTYASVLISALYCFFEIINILNKTDYSLIFNYRFMAMFVVVVASSLIVYSIKSQEEVPDSEKESVSFLFSLAGSFLLLLAISQEVWGVVTRQIENAKGTSVRSLIQFRDVLLSITWAIYGSVAMMVGIYKRSRFFRLFGLILLGVVIFKVFFVDAAGLETIYKILAYITLGILLLVAGFLYNKYKDRIMDFVR